VKWGPEVTNSINKGMTEKEAAPLHTVVDGIRGTDTSLNHISPINTGRISNKGAPRSTILSAETIGMLTLNTS